MKLFADLVVSMFFSFLYLSAFIEASFLVSFAFVCCFISLPQYSLLFLSYPLVLFKLISTGKVYLEICGRLIINIIDILKVKCCFPLLLALFFVIYS